MLFYMLTLSILMTGCSDMQFQTETKAPVSKTDKLVKAQQQALREQEAAAQNSYGDH